MSLADAGNVPPPHEQHCSFAEKPSSSNHPHLRGFSSYHGSHPNPRTSLVDVSSTHPRSWHEQHCCLAVNPASSYAPHSWGRSSYQGSQPCPRTSLVDVSSTHPKSRRVAGVAAGVTAVTFRQEHGPDPTSGNLATSQPGQRVLTMAMHAPGESAEPSSLSPPPSVLLRVQLHPLHPRHRRDACSMA